MDAVIAGGGSTHPWPPSCEASSLAGETCCSIFGREDHGPGSVQLSGSCDSRSVHRPARPLLSSVRPEGDRACWGTRRRRPGSWSPMTSSRRRWSPREASNSCPTIGDQSSLPTFLGRLTRWVGQAWRHEGLEHMRVALRIKPDFLRARENQGGRTTCDDGQGGLLDCDVEWPPLPVLSV
jgi:hypothetical protein